MSPGAAHELFDEAPCGFLSFTDDGRVVVANGTLLGLLGYAREELVGRHVETVMTLATRIFYQTHFFPLVRLHGRADEIYLTLRTKGGAEVAVFVNAVRRSGEGGPVNHCVLFPVHERRKYEDELLKAKKEAEAALASNEALTGELKRALRDLRAAQDRLVREEKLAGLGRLAAGVAHEIKNPLNFVVNFALLIEDLVAELREHLAAASPGGLPPAPAELLEDLTANARKVVEHGRRADAIVRGMMEHARGSTKERPGPVDVNRLVEEHLALLVESRRAEAPGPPVAVERAYGAAAGEVEGAAAELGRVLESLLNNAFDALVERAQHAQERGEAFRPKVCVRTRRTRGAVTVEVSDNGGGVAEAHRGRVFEPFFTTKPAGSGHVGLGLSLAYEIVRGHGGTLDLAPPAGDGATFVVTLPVR